MNEINIPPCEASRMTCVDEAGETNRVLPKLESLSRSIELTRKNRINAANRLEARERFIQAVNIYYSCVSACTTVLALVYPDRQVLSIVSSILTVILAISIVYLNAQKFGARSQQFQMNYIALQQLNAEIQAEMIRNTDDPEKFTRYQSRYAELLKTSENHTPQDHRATMHRMYCLEKRKAKYKNESAPMPKLTRTEACMYWGCLLGNYILHAVIWILPAAAITLLILL